VSRAVGAVCVTCRPLLGGGVLCVLTCAARRHFSGQQEKAMLCACVLLLSEQSAVIPVLIAGAAFCVAADPLESMQEVMDGTQWGPGCLYKRMENMIHGKRESLDQEGECRGLGDWFAMHGHVRWHCTHSATTRCQRACILGAVVCAVAAAGLHACCGVRGTTSSAPSAPGCAYCHWVTRTIGG
jgi:hypothetical protein